ncbi:MAG: hypothetical protein V1865_01140 [bacterium]
MLNYLEVFKTIPDDIRAKITNPEKVAEIKKMDQKYQLDIGDLVIRIVIKDIKWDNLMNYLVKDITVPTANAEALIKELKEKIFYDLLEYVGIKEIDGPPAMDAKKEMIREVSFNSPQIKPAPTIVNNDQSAETEAKIEKVIKKTNIKFSSQIMETRFRQILRTYLKGVRNRINTKATIIKPFDLGGLGLDEKSAKNIFSMLNEENKPGQTKIKPPARIKVPEDRKDFAKRDLGYDLATALKDKPILKKTEESALTKSPEKIAPPSPGIIKMTENKIPEQVKSNQPIIKPVPKRNPITKIERTGSGKIKMDDIRAVPKVLSPVDELRYMTMVNFRNLNPDPNRRIEIILEKIELFREEEYAKKIAGINAWKLSPVNQAYVNILKSSISNGQSINTVLAEQLKQNPSFMTQDEFNAILKLNKQLSY